MAGKRKRAQSSKAATHAAAKHRKRSATKWSAEVMRKSDAMDLQAGVFKLRTPAAVARSLKRSSESSHRRKSTPFRSAMSMLNFEINRGGRNLTRERLHVLEQAKQELRRLFGRPLK
jgi:hypothetical protein